MQGNFEVYQLILRGLIKSIIFAALLTWMVDGFGKAPRPETKSTVNVDRAVKYGAWLAVVYLALYMLFGYYVAWQSQELRLFYGGPAQLNSFINQWLIAFMQMPELPVFHIFAVCFGSCV